MEGMRKAGGVSAMKNIENEMFNQLETDIDLLDFDFPIEIPGFDLDMETEDKAIETDILIVKRYPRHPASLVKYEYAEQLADNVPVLDEGDCLFSIVSGNFIFGDFLEALMVKKNYFAEEMLIATLSLGKKNVDSLRNLQEGGYLGNLSLVVSDFWFAHERRSAGGVPYIIATLGGENFSFAAAGLHTKITLIKTDCGKHLVIHGSANLRSSRNLEQFVIENNRELYEFNHRWISRLVENFSATSKSERGESLWHQVQERQKKENSPIGEREYSRK